MNESTLNETKAGRPFSDWCGRVAILEDSEMAAYRIGETLKHKGVGIAWTGSLPNSGMLLRIMAHDAKERDGLVTFPADALFRPVTMENLPDGRIAIGLEQVVEGQSALPRFEAEFAEWAASVPGAAISTDPAQLEAAKEPFARWAPDAKEGDAPLHGVIYEFEDAVSFAAIWAGCTREEADAVLATRERYLALAGISGVEADDALLRERETMRHLLPDTPDFIDDRESDYVALVTGLSLDLISRVNAGELAYMDQLGLIEWMDEDERDKRLGAPHGDLP